MNVLVISTLYPNRAQPVHALFVEQRVQAMAKRFPLRVLCPVPSFPGTDHLARYRHRLDIPRHETRGGVEVRYPRFLSIPRFCKPLDGWFLYRACRREARRLASEFAFDRIDAHLAFPDGWGALRLGRELGLPVTVTLRGHDINDLPKYPVRGRQVAETLREADAVFCVADALRDAAIELGAPPDRVRTVPNGVDPDRFAPVPQAEAREALGLPVGDRIILSVGHLVERKGFHHLIRALPRIRERVPNACLAIVGAPGEEGDFRAELDRAIAETGMQEFVRFAGAVAHDRLGLWYAAADLFCLASLKEGRPNVVLEAIACGTPVVATRVWGTPEIVSDESLGRLVDAVDPAALAPVLAEALETPWNRARIAGHAGRFSWDETARQVEETLAGLGRQA